MIFQEQSREKHKNNGDRFFIFYFLFLLFGRAGYILNRSKTEIPLRRRGKIERSQNRSPLFLCFSLIIKL